jgi:uridine kinase
MISAPSLPKLVAAIRARTPCGATRITAVDGPGGAGKSTLASALAAGLGAQVVHTDDFASWENPVDWWPALVADVLEPLTRRDVARFEPTFWGGDVKPKPVVEVQPGGDVIVEGVSASREAFRPYLAFAIWIETPRDLRLARGLERDGADALPLWERWMAEEDAYVERERPHEHVDVVVRGDV